MLINSRERVGTEFILYKLNKYTHLPEGIRNYKRCDVFESLFFRLKMWRDLPSKFFCGTGLLSNGRKVKLTAFGVHSVIIMLVTIAVGEVLLKFELYWKGKESPESEHLGSPEGNITRRKYPSDVAIQVSPLTSLSLESSI